MEIKSLPQEVRSQIRNGTNINNITQCVTELVLNSLDAKSTAIAVRVNLLTFQIQVVDNGKGVTKSNMTAIGNRFMTNKCRSLADLKDIKYFGFRGEALASIRGISKSLTITSRPQDVENTYSKVFKNDKWSEVENVKQRPSKGTTITVEGFMNKLPVRQKRINQTLDLENIRQMLESLSIIHSKVSFNLRNDINGKTILKSSKTLSVSQTLINFHPHISIENLVQVKVSKDKTTISGLICKSMFSNNKLQLLYLNKRMIISSRIQKLVNSLLTKSTFLQKAEDQAGTTCPDINAGIKKNEHPIYVLNIRCPYSEVDLTLSPAKKNVEFKNWDVVLACFRKAVNSLIEEKSDDLSQSEGALNNTEKLIEKCKSQFGISQIRGVVKSVPVRRTKFVEQPITLPEEGNKSKSSHYSIIEVTHSENKSKESNNTMEKILLSMENEIKNDSTSQVSNKNNTGQANTNNKTRKHKVEEKGCDSNSTDSDNFFYNAISKKRKIKNQEIDKLEKSNSKLRNSAAKDSPVIPLKKVAEKVGTRKLSDIAEECKDLSFGNKNENKFPLFYLNERDKKKTKSKPSTKNSIIAKKQKSDKNISSSPCKSIEQDNLENENQGKKLIMDMFLKSTAVFSPPKEENENNCDEKKDDVVEIKRDAIIEANKESETNENIQKEKQISSGNFFSNVCYGQQTVNDILMPELNSIKGFCKPMISEDLEEFLSKNIKKDKIFAKENYITKNICYAKSTYKATIPKSMLNVDTYQQLLEPKSGLCSIFDIQKKNFSNLRYNLPNYKKGRQEEPLCLYQEYHHTSHIPNINDILFQKCRISYNSATINKFALKFCKNIDEVSRNFKSFDGEFDMMKPHKSILKLSRFDFPSKLENYKSDFGRNYFGRKAPPYQQALQPVKMFDFFEPRVSLFKKPRNMSCSPKQIYKPKRLTGRKEKCHSPYFSKPNKRNAKEFVSKMQKRIFNVKENAKHPKKYKHRNAVVVQQSPFFKKERNYFREDEMNKSKYFEKKKKPLFVQKSDLTSNFFNELQELSENGIFEHFKKVKKVEPNKDANFFSKAMDTKISKPLLLENAESNSQAPLSFFPINRKNKEQTEFFECIHKQPQRSKLSLKKIKEYSPIFEKNPSKVKERKSNPNLQPLIFHADNFKDNNNITNNFEKNDLPLQNIDITFKHGKLVCRDKDDTDTEPNKIEKPMNSTLGFQNFQPILSSTIIDNKDSPEDEDIEKSFFQTKKFDYPQKAILQLSGKKENSIDKALQKNQDNGLSLSNPLSEIDRSILCNEEREINGKFRSNNNVSILNATIEELKNTLVPSLNINKNADHKETTNLKTQNILSTSIFDLKMAFQISFDQSKDEKLKTQKPYSAVNTSIDKLKNIFTGTNKKVTETNNPRFVKSSSNNVSRELTENVNQNDKITNDPVTEAVKTCEDSLFALTTRIEFIPKGFSPMLRKSKPVDLSLSPASKQALNTAIMETYEDELNTIKWKNLIHESTDDVKQFFDELYKEKARQYHCLIPNAINTMSRGMIKICNNLEAESITKDIFTDLNIVGQWDNKFIIAVAKKREILLLFDQHAVHERIRLETLLDEYIDVDQEAHKFKTTTCSEPLMLELNDSEISVLLSYQYLFEDLGLSYKICSNNIYIFSVPTCIYNRISKNSIKYQAIELKKFISSLIREEMNTILSNRGIVVKVPSVMQNVLNSEACRGAIKFGEKLNLDECALLIEKLSKCKLPFQCAHGRPTITPIINLRSNNYNKKRQLNYKKLKC